MDRANGSSGWRDQPRQTSPGAIRQPALAADVVPGVAGLAGSLQQQVAPHEEQYFSAPWCGLDRVRDTRDGVEHAEPTLASPVVERAPGAAGQLKASASISFASSEISVLRSDSLIARSSRVRSDVTFWTAPLLVETTAPRSPGRDGHDRSGNPSRRHCRFTERNRPVGQMITKRPSSRTA